MQELTYQFRLPMDSEMCKHSNVYKNQHANLFKLRLKCILLTSVWWSRQKVFFTFYVLIIQGLLLDRYIIFREHNQNT